MDINNSEQDAEENLPIKAFNENFVPIVVALLVGIFIAVTFVIIKKRKLERKDFIIVGICDSGKTVLYLQVAHNTFLSTFTSIIPNISEYECNDKMIKIIDIPGHDRVRDKYLDQYKFKTKGLIFVIDSVTIQKEICEVADCLYGVLTDSALFPCSILIACNKQDEPMSKSAQVVKILLEKEMNLIRKTRGSQLKTVDENDKKSKFFLGKEGKDFCFDHITQKVEFVECSAKENQVKYVREWIKKTL